MLTDTNEQKNLLSSIVAYIQFVFVLDDPCGIDFYCLDDSAKPFRWEIGSLHDLRRQDDLDKAYFIGV